MKQDAQVGGYEDEVYVDRHRHQVDVLLGGGVKLGKWVEERR